MAREARSWVTGGEEWYHRETSDGDIRRRGMWQGAEGWGQGKRRVQQGARRVETGGKGRIIDRT
jgi:hypothetical protein